MKRIRDSILFFIIIFLFVSYGVGCQAPPTICFGPSSLSLNASQGETNLLTTTLQISNSGDGTLDWSVSADAPWLTLSPINGSSTGETDEVIVSINTGILSVGNYNTTITISALGVSTSRTLPLKLTIAENPRYIYENGAILVGGDGEPIELVNNPNATNPTYARLVAFIKKDPTDRQRYISSADVSIGSGEVPYVCSDFAEDLHNNAEAAGIIAAWVSIKFAGDNEGHACNAFETTDRGLVYIDCTGGNLWDQLTFQIVETDEGLYSINNYPISWDKVAYIEVGKAYGAIDIARASSLSYSFYEEYKQDCENFDNLIDEYNREVMRFNREVSEYEELLDEYNEDVEKYNTVYQGYVYLISLTGDPLRSIEFLDSQFLLHFGLTYKEVKTYLEEQNLSLAERSKELESLMASLMIYELWIKEKRAEIDKLHEEIGDYSYESLGIVEDIHIYW